MHLSLFLLVVAAGQLLLLLPLDGAFSGVADFKSGQLLTREWMEVGFVDLDDAEWVTVTTKSTTFNSENDTNLAIFISLTSYGGKLNTLPCLDMRYAVHTFPSIPYELKLNVLLIEF